MERKQPETVVAGMKYLDSVLPLLERLRDVGCARDRAGNRELRMPQYVGLVLLSLFNPTLGSLRGLQQASELEKVQRKLGTRRFSLGALSEAGRVFDPDQLGGIIGELLAKLPGAPLDANLSSLRHTLTAVDGTLLKALPQITQACYATRRDLGWKLHTHFDVGKRIPTRMTLTDASGRGKASESVVLRGQLERDHCYLLDRGYEEFALFNAIHAVRSSYVARLRPARKFTPDDTRTLSEAARQAGVAEDAVGKLGSENSRAEPIDHRVRRIVLLVPWTPSRSGKPTPPSSKPASGLVELVLVTNLCDVPARDHRRIVSLSLDDRAVLPVLQAGAGLSTPALRTSPRHPTAGLLCADCLFVDRLDCRSQSQPSHVRDDLPVLPGLGDRNRASEASGAVVAARQNQTKLIASRPTTACRVRAVHAAR